MQHAGGRYRKFKALIVIMSRRGGGSDGDVVGEKEGRKKGGKRWKEIGKKRKKWGSLEDGKRGKGAMVPRNGTRVLL